MLSTTSGTAAPRPASTTRLVPKTRTSVLFEAKVLGANIQTSVTAPGMASICAAGPVRVCQNSKASAIAAGTMAPRIRWSRSTSRRASQASRPQPISPAAGRPRMKLVVRQPWR